MSKEGNVGDCLRRCTQPFSGSPFMVCCCFRPTSRFKIYKVKLINKIVCLVGGGGGSEVAALILLYRPMLIWPVAFGNMSIVLGLCNYILHELYNETFLTGTSHQNKISDNQISSPSPFSSPDKVRYNRLFFAVFVNHILPCYQQLNKLITCSWYQSEYVIIVF